MGFWGVKRREPAEHQYLFLCFPSACATWPYQLPHTAVTKLFLQWRTVHPQTVTQNKSSSKITRTILSLKLWAVPIGSLFSWVCNLFLPFLCFSIPAFSGFSQLSTQNTLAKELNPVYMAVPHSRQICHWGCWAVNTFVLMLIKCGWEMQLHFERHRGFFFVHIW